MITGHLSFPEVRVYKLLDQFKIARIAMLSIKCTKHTASIFLGNLNRIACAEIFFVGGDRDRWLSFR